MEALEFYLDKVSFNETKERRGEERRGEERRGEERRGEERGGEDEINGVQFPKERVSVERSIKRRF
jgi:hypothetical protein